MRVPRPETDRARAMVDDEHGYTRATERSDRGQRGHSVRPAHDSRLPVRALHRGAV